PRLRGNDNAGIPAAGHSATQRFAVPASAAINSLTSLRWRSSSARKASTACRYLEGNAGRLIQSVWTDVKGFRGAASESVGYATQKPEKLLSRIIEASSQTGGL